MATVHQSQLNSGLKPPAEMPRSNGAREERLAASGRPFTNARDERLRSEASQTARSWRLLDSAEVNQPFAKNLDLASRKIGRVIERLQQSVSAGSVLQGDAAVVLAHLLPIRTALRECRQALRGKAPLPRVERDDWAAPVPRVYAVVVSYLEAADEVFDEARLAVFAAAVQKESPLQMRELWNLKAYLEFALLERIAELVQHLPPQSASQINILNPKNPGRLRRCAESLRRVLDLDWKTLFEQIDETDKILKTDPLRVYSRMDFESRDSYRAAIAAMAARSNYSEQEVAHEAIVLARQSHRAGGWSGRAKERRTHVGYFLIGPGQKTLKRRIGYRPTLLDRVRSIATESPDYCYFVSLELAALALVVSSLAVLHLRPPAVWIFVLFLLAALECAVALTNSAVTGLLPPRKLPKLDFSKGIPSDCATVVVVPTLLTSEAQVRRAVKDLEIRFLGNRDRNLHFVLLTDPPDSKRQFDDKDGLAELCSGLIEELNSTYAGKKNGSFFHFHRPRTFNSREGVWMGWERKRGKLLQFNRYLLGQKEDAFPVKTGNLAALAKVRYAITLDADTQLPAGAAHRMVGALAHPLNAAVIDPETNTVVEGYGILQPRVDISVHSAHRSRLASLFSGETGLDIYTRAVSDVYQDLFGEAIFSGKGIYEISAFQRVLDNRLPGDSILSHDLIESAYARAGLLSDVEVIDDYPSTFSALTRRKHRWIRGDWQISPWLAPRVRNSLGRVVKNPISHVSRWKILDNLRRSLTDVALFGAFVYAWLAMPQDAVQCTLLLLSVLLLPLYLRIGTGILRAGREIFSVHFWKGIYSDWASSHARIYFRLAFLCHHALLASDAVLRTLVRMNITRRHMLEWETAADAESISKNQHVVDTYVGISAFLSVGIGVVLSIVSPAALWVALPFLASWAALPKMIQWLDRPAHAGQPELSRDGQALVRNAGLRTWRFFREFSTPEENWLIPDLLQQTPPLVAHRVSTTNLGLLLNARLAAYDLGYLTPGEFAEQTERTLESVERMPKCDGQLYNWYSTQTLEPDEPLFVSTVDNGNLLCSLWTLKEGCREIPGNPVFRPAAWQAILDHVDLLAEIILDEPESDELAAAVVDLRQRVEALSGEEADRFETFATLEVDTTIFLEKLAECFAGEEIRWWAGELKSRVKEFGSTIADFAPWQLPEFSELRQYLGSKVPRPSSLTLEACPSAYAELSSAIRGLVDRRHVPEQLLPAAQRLSHELERAAATAQKLAVQLTQLADTAQRFADAMDFSIFFDDKREMLAIGYDAAEGCISKWHYDLLPSEARSAAFGGIAQGSIPHKTWFRLGRFHGIHNRQPLLYSWSGTMFEYLMPCLWTKSHRNSLLERSARAAIRVQQKFAQEKGDIPWGVSECACNEYTPDGHYVYHAFGVPKLALHRDEYSSDVVIAPYATFLAMMIEPLAAIRNAERMKALGWLGEYGFYDAVDFTKRRLAPGKRHEIVRTWMAHHQGMTLVAISNVLCDSAMQRRFHADSRVAAAERVLHEMPPRAIPAWEQEIIAAFRPVDADSLTDAAKSAA